MFKKLKDKIAEEVKQSPLKFQTSVQQLTQAVSISGSTNSLNNSETNELDDEEKFDTSNDLTLNSEYDGSFTTVDLRSPTPLKNRRSSSSSTINSELFPIYELPAARFSIQSDLESNSEFDDGSSIHQFTNISKENLYEKYRTALQKYHKYRGRFVDTQKCHQELQREYSKVKNILTETQDKALRRIAELREQCNLEQKAKAHLEEVLRNEVEERDHVIDTLKTKIDLLKSGKDPKQLENDQKSNDLKNPPESDQSERISSLEVDSLKEKIKNYENLLSKAKEAVTRRNTQIQEMQTKMELDQKEQKSLNERIADLQRNIDLMKRKEEEALLSLAENKLVIHRELEAKEAHIKNLEDKISLKEKEIKQLKTRVEGQDDMVGDVVSDTECDAATTKDVEIKKLRDELHKLKSIKSNEPSSSQNKDRIIDEYKRTVEFSNQELHKLKNQIEASDFLAKSENRELNKLRKELDDCRATIAQLNASLFSREEESKTLRIEKDSKILQLTKDNESKNDRIVSLEKNLSTLKSQLGEKTGQIKSYDEKITVLNREIEKSKSELQAANTKLKDKKSWEEKELNLTADKIVLEEILKNLKTELNSTKENLKTANVKIETFENQLKSREKEITEKQAFETRLKESETKLAQSQVELERAKNAELELAAQTGKLLDEINSLKSRQDEYLTDIRNLKSKVTLLQNLNNELQNLDARFNDTMRECKKSNEQNEILKSQNDLLKTEMETLQTNFQELEKLTSDYDNVKTENELLAKQLRVYRDQNEELQKIKSLEKEEQEKSWKLECEELRSRVQQGEFLKEENDNLKAETRKFGDEIRIFAEHNEVLRTEKETLEDELRKVKADLADQKNRFEILSKDFNDAERNLESKGETEETIKRLNSELSSLRTTIEQSRNENENYRKIWDRVKEVIGCEAEENEFITSLHDMKNRLESLTRENTTLKKSTNINDTKLLDLRNQVLSLKTEYFKFKNHLKHDFDTFRLHYISCKTQISNEASTVAKNFVKEYSSLETNYSDLKNQFEYLDNENELLKNEKEELSLEMDEMATRLKQVNDRTSVVESQSEIQILKQKYSQEVKEMVAGYEARLAEKDNEYEELRNKLYMREDRETINMQRETKEIISNLQEDLTLKQDSYDELLAKYRQQVKETEIKISELKDHYAKELRESDKKWRSCLDKRIEEIEDKHKEEINELTKEWTVDRKKIASVYPTSNSVDAKFLEESAKQCEDTEALKKQVQVLSNELHNCKRSQWRDISLELTDVSLEDCTEMEYLRNILFEYMMGHQPLILAKVLAAIVKFDNKQTKQILQREEQKQTLLGQLGLS